MRSRRSGPSLRRGQAFPLNPLPGLLGFLGVRDHLVPESGLQRLIADHLEHERLEEMPVPLHVVAVDVVTGEELRSPKVQCSDAVHGQRRDPRRAGASASGRTARLMDGGVANNTPISHAVELGARGSTSCRPGTLARSRRPPEVRWGWLFTR